MCYNFFNQQLYYSYYLIGKILSEDYILDYKTIEDMIRTYAHNYLHLTNLKITGTDMIEINHQITVSLT